MNWSVSETAGKWLVYCCNVNLDIHEDHLHDKSSHQLDYVTFVCQDLGSMAQCNPCGLSCGQLAQLTHSLVTGLGVRILTLFHSFELIYRLWLGVLFTILFIGVKRGVVWIGTLLPRSIFIEISVFMFNIKVPLAWWVNVSVHCTHEGCSCVRNYIQGYT